MVSPAGDLLLFQPAEAPREGMGHLQGFCSGRFEGCFPQGMSSAEPALLRATTTSVLLQCAVSTQAPSEILTFSISNGA